MATMPATMTLATIDYGCDYSDYAPVGPVLVGAFAALVPAAGPGVA